MKPCNSFAWQPTNRSETSFVSKYLTSDHSFTPERSPTSSSSRLAPLCLWGNSRVSRINYLLVCGVCRCGINYLLLCGLSHICFVAGWLVAIIDASPSSFLHPLKMQRVSEICSRPFVNVIRLRSPEIS